ncbi:glucose-6-phosphate isomerase [Cohnella lupini]|uniref:glucose-6-phosphate isomerase n=1 Tax=Cohnella lupini TaxID=1294267 RepID=A0A3D9IWS9_9BACL|nr:glucose-6-phosphate isomerase [Cohnella lupini]RED66171.1 glucose-6-phosphate isomerase [Cohnella lupini]
MSQANEKANRIATLPFSAHFDLASGLSNDYSSTKRPLSKMLGMYSDAEAFQVLVEAGDPDVYEFYELTMPDSANELLFGTSIVYPGRVGREYYMTKGHFHTILDTPEVYYCLNGQGYMLMENPEGDWKAERFLPGQAVYVPPRYAHRSINTGDVPLVTFFVYRADSGHDYGTLETKGFRKLIVDRNGQPEIVDNPKWSGER